MAGKLGVDTKTLAAALESLSFLLHAVVREGLKGGPRRTFLFDLGFSEDACTVLDAHVERFANRVGAPSARGAQTADADAHFDRLQWRLDVQLGGRALRRHDIVRYTLALGLKTGHGDAQVAQGELAVPLLLLLPPRHRDWPNL